MALRGRGVMICVAAFVLLVFAVDESFLSFRGRLFGNADSHNWDRTPGGLDSQTTESSRLETEAPKPPPHVINTFSPTLRKTFTPTEAKSTSSPSLQSTSAPSLPSFRQRIFLAYPNINKSYVDKCQAIDIPEPRGSLDCEKELSATSIYPNFFDSPKRKRSHSEWRFRNVTVLQDTDWGFTCNKLEILGGAIWRMITNKAFPEAETNMLALGPIFTGLAWELDLKFLTRDFPILLDCVECQENETDINLVRCGSVVVDGEVLDIRQEAVFFTQNKYWAVDLYWNNGPSSLGLHPALTHYLLPREALRRSMEKAMMGRDQKTLGLHRRDMENWCYRYIGGGRGEFECHINGEAYPIIDKMLEAKTPEKFENKFYFKPLEAQYPWIAVCNYTLDEEQLAVYHKEWPDVFVPGKKMQMLFTTDSNDVNGDKILANSPVIETLFRTKDISTDVGCLKDKHRMLFYDMYGLALSDYHMSNPLSSCDVTVVHWRKVLGKGRETSYPQACYHGYYDQKMDYV